MVIREEKARLLSDGEWDQTGSLTENLSLLSVPVRQYCCHIPNT